MPSAPLLRLQFSVYPLHRCSPLLQTWYPHLPEVSLTEPLSFASTVGLAGAVVSELLPALPLASALSLPAGSFAFAVTSEPSFTFIFRDSGAVFYRLQYSVRYLHHQNSIHH